jgi:hypothetical protein
MIEKREEETGAVALLFLKKNGAYSTLSVSPIFRRAILQMNPHRLIVEFILTMFKG